MVVFCFPIPYRRQEDSGVFSFSNMLFIDESIYDSKRKSSQSGLVAPLSPECKCANGLVVGTRVFGTVFCPLETGNPTRIFEIVLLVEVCLACFRSPQWCYPAKTISSSTMPRIKGRCITVRLGVLVLDEVVEAAGDAAAAGAFVVLLELGGDDNGSTCP